MRNFVSGVHETLAEIARLTHEIGRPKGYAKVALELWMRLYDFVNESYDKIKGGKP